MRIRPVQLNKYISALINPRKLRIVAVSGACLFSLDIAFISSACARELPVREITADENDFALRESLFAGDLEKFEYHLTEGGDPTAWLDDSQYGWVLCAANERGREAFLGVLIEKGYDVNYHQKDIASSISLPLACAVRFTNLEAIELLVEAGADPTVAPSIKYPERVPRSILSQAIIVGKYELAVWLFDKGDYSDEQLRSDIGMLERHPVDESAEGNKYRLQLADLLREKGYEVTPWTRQQPSGQ